MKDDGFRLLELDLSARPLPDPSTLMQGEPFVVFHLAAQAGVRSSWGSEFNHYTRDNINATQRLLEWCLQAGSMQNFVFASSSSVYGNAKQLPMHEDTTIPKPYSPYGVTKLAAENLISLYHENYNLPAVSCRFFTVYGPRQRPDMAFNRFITAGLKGRPITVYGSGEQTRDFTFVKDITDGLIKAQAVTDGQIFNLGGGNRVTLNEALDSLQEVTGIELKLLHDESQQGDVKDTLASTEKAREYLNWTPSTTLEEGLRKEFDWIETILASPSSASDY
jgi:nucleoside-diphosphate-sugar epimerase